MREREGGKGGAKQIHIKGKNNDKLKQNVQKDT